MNIHFNNINNSFAISFFNNNILINGYNNTLNSLSKYYPIQSGRGNSGIIIIKYTIANYLVEKYGFINYGFADPIKEVGKIVFGFNDAQLEGCLKDTMDNFWGISPREFFQNFGTDIAQFEFPKYFPNMYRNQDKRAIWVKVFEIWYLKKINDNPDLKVVISDLRFIHEYEYYFYYILKKL